MKLAVIESYPYALPLARPLPGAPAEQLERAGILIRLRSEAGAEGWGDVAPLPSFSRETLAAACAQLFSLRPALVDTLPVFKRQTSWQSALLHPLSAWDLFPSVRFGLESAVCNLAAAEWGTPWRLHLAKSALAKVQLNALLTGAREDILRGVRSYVERGYSSLKIKVGHHPVSDKIATVRQVSSLLPPGVTLRLDANRAWSLAVALEFAHGVRNCPIDYIEEPLREVAEMQAFIRGSALPAALDESLDLLGAGALPQGLRAIVIKPTLRGGFSGALRWAKTARQSGVAPVISSAFESAIGLRALAELASVIHDPGVAAGLDTGRWLARDVAEPAFDVIAGAVNVATLSAHPVKLTIDMSGGTE